MPVRVLSGRHRSWRPGRLTIYRSINPFSEAGFKTLKYRPDFPDRFGCIEDARAFCQGFFAWYNNQHRHSGIALFAPADVHYGRSDELLVARAGILAGA